MTCNNCNKINDNDSNYCKYCGDNLKPEIADRDTTIFETRSQTAITNNELGYLVIALLVILNTLLWMIGPWISNSITDNETTYIVLRVFSIFFSIAQFVVMFIYARKKSYRVIIGIIAVFAVLINMFYLLQTFRLRY